MATVDPEGESRDSEVPPGDMAGDLPRDLAHLLLVAIHASLQAGRAILEVYRSDFCVETKEDRTPLTLADRRAHSIILRRLEETGIPILSEEGQDIPYEVRRGWRRLWIVDPLDGTKEFIQRNGEFTVNIALVEEGTPIVGVVHAPARGLLYFGSRGWGAFRLDMPGMARESKAGEPGAVAEVEDWQFLATLEQIVARSRRLPLPQEAAIPHPVRARRDPYIPSGAQATQEQGPAETTRPREEAAGRKSGAPSSRPLVVVGSRSHGTPELSAYVEELRRRHGQVEFISAGSSLKFCLVAEGSADIYPRLGPTMEWDTAAGQAIAEAVGRRVLVWGEDHPLRYNREYLRNPSFMVS